MIHHKSITFKIVACAMKPYLHSGGEAQGPDPCTSRSDVQYVDQRLDEFFQ